MWLCRASVCGAPDCSCRMDHTPVGKSKSRPLIGIVAIILWIGGVITASLLDSRLPKNSVWSRRPRKLRHLPASTATNFMWTWLSIPMIITSTVESGSDFDLTTFPTTPSTKIHCCFQTLLLIAEPRLVVSGEDNLLSAGKDLKVARKNTESFTYPLQLRDSLLLLPEFFSANFARFSPTGNDCGDRGASGQEDRD